MQNMPEEVILALVLIDLHFDIQSNRTVVRTGYGKNWWFLACDCNDEYHDVVKKVLLKCSHYEAVALCFMEGGNSSNKWSVISRATPKCKSELQKFLRFAGRYEFEGEPKLFDSVKGLTVYDAFDYGSYDEQRKEKKKVTLRCMNETMNYFSDMERLKVLLPHSRFSSSFYELGKCQELVRAARIKDEEATKNQHFNSNSGSDL
jgi:hypothetical protein